MPSPTLAGAPVLEARVRLPRAGAWVASVSVDTRDLPSGRVELVVRDQTFAGTVRRAGLWRGTASVQLVGGAGGLATPLPPKAYRSTPLRIPLGDVLTAAGETLASDADEELLGRTLTAWVRTAGPGSAALERLLAGAGPGYGWRVKAEGAVWVGAETWPELELADAQLLVEEPHEGRAVVWDETLALRPGVTFMGRRVSLVEHHLSPDRLRSTVTFED